MRISTVYQNYRNQNNYSMPKTRNVCFGSSPLGKMGRHLRTEDKTLFDTLGEYLKRITYSPDRKNLTILNIGCGMGYGTEGLAHYFEDAAPDLKVYGIDPAFTIERAPLRYGHLGEKVKFFQCYLQDALEIEPALRNNADFIMVRHPDINIDTSLWFDTVEKSHDNLRNNGLMVFTTWEKGEMDTIRGFAKNKGYNIAIDEKNCLNYGLDNYIMVLQKTNPN